MRPAIEQSLLFDNRTPFQTDWLGVGANYMGFAAFPELALTAPQQIAEFDRAETSGIKVARTWYGTNWAMPSYPSGSPDWSSASMTAFYTWLSAMQTRGINVILTTGWSFPGDVCGLAMGGVTPSCTPTPSDEAVWAAWISESLNQIINVRGFTNVIGCFFFTEPNQAADTNIPVGYTDQEYYVHLVTVARDKIVADDSGRTPIRPQILICGTEEHSFTNDSWTEYMVANTSGLFDVYTAHSYIGSPVFVPFGIGGSNNPDYATWIARFTNWTGDASPTPMWADEINTVVGGDFDSTGYRATADAGWQFCRWIDGHMQGGCRASIPWTLQDQTHWPSGSTYSQAYGLAKWIGDGPEVNPSWYAVTMLANLTGGAGGTSLYRSVNGTSSLHGTGVVMAPGVRGVTDPLGDISFVVINESALPTRVEPRFMERLATDSDRPWGRTFYRYVYSAETPPAAAADPAYLVPWDASYANVRRNITPNVVPGRSVVIYSTINMAAPVAASVSGLATATTDSTASTYSADNVNDGNRSNVVGTYNGWKKADDSSHYVELTWDSAQTIGRVALAFVGTTAGVVYATYADTSSPTVLADYTVQYWNGSAFVDFSTPVSVTGNLLPNREHSFAPVSTTKIRLTVISAAASGQVNQLGAFAA